MRFLLGMIIGAVMTLFVATAIDAPTNPLVGKLSELWRELIHTTGQTLFVQPAHPLGSQHETPPTRASTRPPRGTEQTPAAKAQTAAAAGRQRQPTSEPSAPTAAAPARDAKPHSVGLPAGSADRIATLPALPAPAARSPASTPSTPATLPPSASAGLSTEVPGDDELRTSATRTPQGATSQSSGIGTEFATTVESPIETGTGADTVTATETETETASVWTPFHSEVSARGFARRLTRQLDYPFAVLREGPGAYQVVFRYESTTQRDLVLSQLAALTSR